MSHVLIVRACAIGDFVLNLPALRALALQDPGARFTLVGYPATLQLARPFIPVEAIQSMESPPWSDLFSGPVRFPEGVGFDAAYVWMKDPTIGENLTRSGVPKVFRAEPFPASGHAASHLLDTVGLPAPDLPDLWTRASGRILLQPGSGSPAKCWPYFEELAASLPDAAILLGPCESGFKARSRTDHLYLEGLSLMEVAEEIRRCRFFIGNDSGITHIAAYWGCPVAALFGPTDPRIWGPVGKRVDILWKSSLADISISEVRELI